MAEPPPVAGAREVASPEAVEAAWARLAADIQPLVDSGPSVMLGVLIGGMVPLVKIAERLRGDFLMDYCHLTRYDGSLMGGPLHWIQRPRTDLRGRTVILVDDIFDEGRTLAELRRFCLSAGASRVVVAVLAWKHHARLVTTPAPEFFGLEVPDEYVIGCGMDYHGRWRHLNAIFALPETATKFRPTHPAHGKP